MLLKCQPFILIVSPDSLKVDPDHDCYSLVLCCLIINTSYSSLDDSGPHAIGAENLSSSSGFNTEHRQPSSSERLYCYNLYQSLFHQTLVAQNKHMRHSSNKQTKTQSLMVFERKQNKNRIMLLSCEWHI